MRAQIKWMKIGIWLFASLFYQVAAANPLYSASFGKYHSADDAPLQAKQITADESSQMGVALSFEATGDTDSDGYHFGLKTELTFTDSSLQTDAYVRLYLRAKKQPERLLYTSDSFPTFSGGRYAITTTLQQSLEANEYALRVEIVSTETNAVLVNLSPQTNTSLANIRLESRDYDWHPPAWHSIYSVWVELSGDFDHDGHYANLDVEVDADTVYDADWVFLQILLRDNGGSWRVLALSPDYLIHGNSTYDSYLLHLSLPTWYHPGHYDLRVELFDSDSGYFLTSYGPISAHIGLPLESASDDSYTGVYVSGTASSGLISIGVLLLLAGWRVGRTSPAQKLSQH